MKLRTSKLYGLILTSLVVLNISAPLHAEELMVEDSVGEIELREEVLSAAEDGDNNIEDDGYKLIESIDLDEVNGEEVEEVIISSFPGEDIKKEVILIEEELEKQEPEEAKKMPGLERPSPTLPKTGLKDFKAKQFLGGLLILIGFLILGVYRKDSFL